LISYIIYFYKVEKPDKDKLNKLKDEAKNLFQVIKGQIGHVWKALGLKLHNEICNLSYGGKDD